MRIAPRRVDGESNDSCCIHLFRCISRCCGFVCKNSLSHRSDYTKYIFVTDAALFCAVVTQNLLLIVIPVDFHIAWFV